MLYVFLQKKTKNSARIFMCVILFLFIYYFLHRVFLQHSFAFFREMKKRIFVWQPPLKKVYMWIIQFFALTEKSVHHMWGGGKHTRPHTLSLSTLFLYSAKKIKFQPLIPALLISISSLFSYYFFSVQCNVPGKKLYIYICSKTYMRGF